MKLSNRVKLIGVLAGLASLSLSVMSFAADKGPHDAAIQARQAMFKLYGFNSGLLSDMAKGKVPYDAELAVEAATNLNAAANLGQSRLWPQGSDNETDGNATTRALPAIWNTFPAITEKADALKQATAALVPVAGNGLDALKGAMGDVGASCKGCHDDYRAKKR